MVRKSDVVTIFPTFFKLMENQFNAKVKILQSDGGGKFFNHTLKDYFSSHIIPHRLSCPRAPEKNGIAKRQHRHVAKTSLTLLAHSSVPSQFWTATFHTVVYLINRLPTSVLHNKSPYELVHGSCSSYTSLKVFSCACYPHLTLFGYYVTMSFLTTLLFTRILLFGYHH